MFHAVEYVSEPMHLGSGILGFTIFAQASLNLVRLRRPPFTETLE